MALPNLVFIFTDEQRYDTFAAAGNERIRMPNLNRLAAESCVFEEAYCTQPVCTPSRASILTGLFPHATGAFINNQPLRADVPCLPEMLPDDVRAQYATAYHGKWHLGNEIFAQHGFDEWRAVEDFYRAHYSPENDQDAKCHYYHWLRAQGFRPQGGDVFSRSFCATLPEACGKPAYLEAEASRFIRENRDNPFILYVNFLEPHMPFHGPRTSLYDPDELPLPPTFDAVPGEADTLKNRFMAAQYRNCGHDAYDLSTEAGWRKLRAAYHGLCTLVDDYTGRILRTLTDCGLDENTIVVFTSDHGDMMGAHRILAKQVMYQDSVRVPCMIRLPSQSTPQRVSGPFSQIDLAPTLLELMGQPVPEHTHGRSLAGRLGGDDCALDGDVFIQWNDIRADFIKHNASPPLPDWMTDLADVDRIADAMTEPTRSIVTADGWRMTVSPTLDDHELFNLTDDPGERRNLAGDPQHRDLMNALLARIHTWQKQVADTAELPTAI
jgi:arylsulfatase